MKTALVTGGAGFIGSHIVDRLLKMGTEVRVIDNESSDSHEQFYWNNNCENYKDDICNYSLMEKITKGIDVIFHLAAEARIQPAINNPLLAVKANVLGTCSVLQAARENDIHRVVYSSTSSAYGFNNIPSQEGMVKDCLNPYSVSKTAGEELCSMYTDLFGLETVIFRYFNVYGDRQPTKGQYAPVIGLFLKQHQEGKPMTIVGDGLQRRDYTYVKDVVEANILAAISSDKNIIGELFNIGTGINYNIFDLVECISGKKDIIEDKDFVFVPERMGEVKESLADITKAKEILRWNPKMELKNWIKEMKI